MKKLSKDHSVHITDERINTQTHLVGVILALFGAVLLIVKSSLTADPWRITGFAVYCASLIGVFLASTMHHGINAGRNTDNILRLFDYFAIFPLIAGTYTPLCLLFLRNTFGWSVLGSVWGMSIAGITLKAVFKDKMPKWFSNTIYITIGWVGAVIAFPLLNVINISGIILLVLGGLFYSGGFVIFNIEKPNPFPGKFGFHEIWHILVLLGAASHYLMLYFTV